MNPQICGDDSALHSQSLFDTPTCTGQETKQTETQRENSPNNSLPLTTSCINDQHHREEQQPFDSTTRKRTMEEEETRMITHGSNKTTGLFNSHDDHDSATVSHYSKDTRDCHFIHLSKDPGQTALDQSENIAKYPVSVQA